MLGCLLDPQVSKRSPMISRVPGKTSTLSPKPLHTEVCEVETKIKGWEGMEREGVISGSVQ